MRRGVARYLTHAASRSLLPDVGAAVLREVELEWLGGPERDLAYAALRDGLTLRGEAPPGSAGCTRAARTPAPTPAPTPTAGARRRG